MKTPHKQNACAASYQLHALTLTALALVLPDYFLAASSVSSVAETFSARNSASALLSGMR